MMDDQPLHSLGSNSNVIGIVDKVTGMAQTVENARALMYQNAQQLVGDASIAIGNISRTLQKVDVGEMPDVDQTNSPDDSEMKQLEPLQPLEPMDLPKFDRFESKLNANSFDNIDVNLPPPPPNVNVVVPPKPQIIFDSPPPKPVIDTSFTLPPRPSLDYGNAPVMHGVTLPPLPTVTLPTLSVDLPTWDIAQPDLPNIPVAVGDMTLDKTQFDQFVNMSLGGVPQTLLTVTQEEVGRIADLHRASAQNDIEAVFEEFSGRGYTAPPGALGRRTDVIRAEANAKIRLASRDVAISRMQMEVDVYKANLTTGAQLVQKALDIELQRKRLIMDIFTGYGKQMIEVYNAEVAVFNAKQSGFQALVDIYKAKIQGELSKVDLFKAQIEGAKASLEVDKTAMDGYTAHMQGVTASVEAYRTFVEAAKAELEAKVKHMDMYRTEVEAYVAVINSGKAQYEAYATEVSASMAPLQIYEQMVKSYSAQVQAAGVGAEVYKIGADVAIAKEDANVKGFVASNDAKTTELVKKYEVRKQEMDIQQTQIEYELKVGTYELEQMRLKHEVYKTELNAAIAKYEAALKKFEVNGNFMYKSAEMTVEAAKSTATISGQLASSALSGIHVQQSLSSQAGANFQVQSAGHWNYQKTDKTT